MNEHLVEGELFGDHALVLGETLGWRAWNVIAEDSPHPRLVSASHGTMWPTNRWTAATCGNGSFCAGSTDGRIPGESCSCGLYAARDLEHLLSMHYAYWKPEGLIVVGQVAFAGKVIPGDQGWRAERGRIAQLYVPFSRAELGRRLGEVYDAPWSVAPWWATDPRLGVRR